MAEDASLESGALEVVPIEKVGLLLRPDVLARIRARSTLDRATKSFSSRAILASRARGADLPGVGAREGVGVAHP